MTEDHTPGRPEYPSAEGAGYRPADSPDSPDGERGFPWLAMLAGILAVVLAAAAVWFFLLRETDPSTGTPTGTDSSTEPADAPSDEAGQSPDAAPPDGTEDDRPSEPAAPSDPSSPGQPDDPTTAPDDDQDDERDDDQGDGSTDTGEDDAVDVPLGRAHALPGGATVTLDAVERGAECAALPGRSLALLTFTVEAGPLPIDTPQPGLNLHGSDEDASWLDSVDCVPQSEALTPLVTPMESATGVVAVLEPLGESFTVTFTPAATAIGGDSAAVRWTID